MVWNLEPLHVALTSLFLTAGTPLWSLLTILVHPVKLSLGLTLVLPKVPRNPKALLLTMMRLLAKPTRAGRLCGAEPIPLTMVRAVLLI